MPAKDIPDGLVYVPCSVNIVGAKVTVNAQIVAEGDVQVSGSGITIDPTHAQNPALVSNRSVHIAGQGTYIDGTVQALSGTVKATGANSTYHCGIIANKISMTGAKNSVAVDSRCW